MCVCVCELRPQPSSFKQRVHPWRELYCAEVSKLRRAPCKDVGFQNKEAGRTPQGRPLISCKYHGAVAIPSASPWAATLASETGWHVGGCEDYVFLGSLM